MRQFFAATLVAIFCCWSLPASAKQHCASPAVCTERCAGLASGIGGPQWNCLHKCNACQYADTKADCHKAGGKWDKTSKTCTTHLMSKSQKSPQVLKACASWLALA